MILRSRSAASATEARRQLQRGRTCSVRGIVIVALITAFQPVALAQSFDGYAAVLFNVIPDIEDVPGQRRRSLELRPRVFGDTTVEVGTKLRLRAAGFVESLVAGRGQRGLVRIMAGRPQELHGEFAWSKADLRVGLSRVSWGRLDEFLPTDVVNPLDLSRFFGEGRSEARRAVGMVRARVFPSDRFNVEGIYVPLFRGGRFDSVSNDSSPFNVAPTTYQTQSPRRSVRSAQGGMRVSATTGRVDWSVSGYRGFESFPAYELQYIGKDSETPLLVGHFPRFDMVGGDFESVWGAWGVRGEAAWFLDRLFQHGTEPRVSRGQSVEAGVGLDRRAGSYRIGGNIVVTKRAPFGAESLVDDTDTLVVASIDRSFARETRQFRTFAVYDAEEGSVFARLIAVISLRDDLAIEASLAWFDGAGFGPLGRWARRDFAYGRLKLFF